MKEPRPETSTRPIKRRRRGTTILYANDHRSGAVACFFRAKGKGARDWQFIVDAFDELLPWLENRMGLEVLARDESKSLGEGAVVLVDPNTYAVLRLRFEADPVVADAEQRGELIFDEGVHAMRAVDDLRTRLERAREERRRDE